MSKIIDADELGDQIMGLVEILKEADELALYDLGRFAAYQRVLELLLEAKDVARFDPADAEKWIMTPERAQEYLDAHSEFAEKKRLYEVELRERLGLR